jgi:hypothetical protein
VDALPGVRHRQGRGLLLEDHAVGAVLAEESDVDPQGAASVVAVGDPDEGREGLPTGCRCPSGSWRVPDGGCPSPPSCGCPDHALPRTSTPPVSCPGTLRGRTCGTATQPAHW